MSFADQQMPPLDLSVINKSKEDNSISFLKEGMQMNMSSCKEEKK